MNVEKVINNFGDVLCMRYQSKVNRRLREIKEQYEDLAAEINMELGKFEVIITADELVNRLEFNLSDEEKEHYVSKVLIERLMSNDVDKLAKGLSEHINKSVSK